MSVHKLSKGGYLVLRPDSGDPTEAVLMVRGARGGRRRRRSCYIQSVQRVRGRGSVCLHLRNTRTQPTACTRIANNQLWKKTRTCGRGGLRLGFGSVGNRMAR